MFLLPDTTPRSSGELVAALRLKGKTIRYFDCVPNVTMLISTPRMGFQLLERFEFCFFGVRFDCLSGGRGSCRDMDCKKFRRWPQPPCLVAQTNFENALAGAWRVCWTTDNKKSPIEDARHRTTVPDGCRFQSRTNPFGEGGPSGSSCGYVACAVGTCRQRAAPSDPLFIVESKSWCSENLN